MALALAASAAYALGAAATTPFTVAADVVTAVPIVAMAIAAAVLWPVRPVPVPPAGGGPGQSRRSDGHGHPYRAWVALAAIIAAWELVEYLARGSRGAHPTLSSMLDAVDRIYALKAALFAAWIWLCVWVVRSGRPAPPGAAAGGGAAAGVAER